MFKKIFILFLILVIVLGLKQHNSHKLISKKDHKTGYSSHLVKNINHFGSVIPNQLFEHLAASAPPANNNNNLRTNTGDKGDPQNSGTTAPKAGTAATTPGTTASPPPVTATPKSGPTTSTSGAAAPTKAESQYIT